MPAGRSGPPLTGTTVGEPGPMVKYQAPAVAAASRSSAATAHFQVRAAAAGTRRSRARVVAPVGCGGRTAGSPIGRAVVRATATVLIPPSSAAAPSGRWSRSVGLSAARALRTSLRNSPASAGRWSGSRAVASATRASSSDGTDVHPGGRGGDRAVHVLVGDVDGGVAGERLGAGEHLEEDQPGGIHVAAGVGDAALDLLGREVGHRAEEHARLRRRGLGRHGAGEAEVGDLDRAVARAG